MATAVKELPTNEASGAESKTPSKKKRIFIVDDHPVFVRGISQLIENEAGLQIVGHAMSAPQALSQIEQLDPDLLLVDITIHGTNGIELMKSIKNIRPNLPALFLSMHDEGIYAERALRAGARGYVMKAAPLEKVVEAIYRVLDGGIYLSEPMSEQLLNTFLTGRNEKAGATAIARLSDRELEVFRALGEGRSTREIAESLHLSVKTVETHRAHIKDKLKIGTAADLMRAAAEWVKSEGNL